MGLFGNKRRPEYEKRIVDVHCHILPGIDDGAKNLEQSKAMLDIAWEQGIRKIIATPHHMPEAKNASPEVIAERVRLLQQYVDEQQYDIEIFTGNEIYYWDEAAERLDEGRICQMADSCCVLVEFSPMDDARYIRNSLSELQNMGYDPIIAHVERYMSLCKAPFDKIQELRDMGIFIQVNAASVTGGFGKPTQVMVDKMLKKKLIDFIGTDAHSDRSRAPKMLECAQYLQKKCDADYVEELLYKNAEKYLLRWSYDKTTNGNEDR